MTTFNLRSLRLRSGEEHRDEHDVRLEPLEFGGERYFPVPERVAVELAVIRASSGTLFELRFAGRLVGPCQRCLKDAVIEESISAREYEATNPGSPEELRTPYLTDDRLDLSAWARDSLSLALPDRILCRADCAGLCPVCGADLNREPHVHEEDATDARWAPLADLRHRL